MTIWAIVPVKPLRRGKSRLAGRLSEDERAKLNSLLLAHTLKTLTETPDIDEVLVVSRDPKALAVVILFHVVLIVLLSINLASDEKPPVPSSQKHNIIDAVAVDASKYDERKKQQKLAEQKKIADRKAAEKKRLQEKKKKQELERKKAAEKKRQAA